MLEGTFFSRYRSRVVERTNDAWLAALQDPVDPEALATLRTQLVKNLARGLAGRPLSQADLQDFAQEAVIKVLDKKDAFRGDSQFVTWCTAIALRVALSHLRKKSTQETPTDTMADTPVAPVVERNLYGQRLAAALTEALATVLTDRQRTVIEGELAGQSADALAQTLGAKRNAIYKISHDARVKLRIALADAGFLPSDVREYFGEAS